MSKIGNDYFESEIKRLYDLYLDYKDKTVQIYENLDGYVDKYVYGKSTSMFRGYYNPTLAAHLAIGGNQKGPKPKEEKRKEDTFCLYGLNKEGQPIFSRSYISVDRPAHLYEVS